MKRIEIIIAPDGETKLQTTGFSGTECRAASQFLVTALGMREHESVTSEWYQTIIRQDVQVDDDHASK